MIPAAWPAPSRALPAAVAEAFRHDGKVLVGNRGYGLFAIAADSGTELWKNFFWGSWVESTPVVVDGTIYIGSSDLRRVSAIDPADGRVLWRSDVFGWAWATPVISPWGSFVNRIEEM